MQTFLPYPSFEESARVLDNKRLGKQRVEAFTILRTLSGGISGWKNHPAVKMWKGFEDALEMYYSCMVERWIIRGFNNSMPFPVPKKFVSKPSWLGDERLHASHRSNLLRKDYKWYSQFGWGEKPNLKYWWPVK